MAPKSKEIGGGSLLIAWQLKDKRVLIVGGGEVGSQRIDSLLTTDADITLLAPSSGLNPRTRQFLTSYPTRITHLDRLYSTREDLYNYDMVLTALDDTALSRSIVERCRELRVPVNAADIPELCDFYFGAQIRDGPLQIMISTNGNGPRIAGLIKGRVGSALSGCEGEALRRVGELRARLRERSVGEVGGEVGKRRMKWISGVCERWSLEEMAELDEEMIEKLLGNGWEKGKVLGIEEVGGKKKVERLRVMPSLISFVVGAAVATLIVARLSRPGI